MTKHQGPIPDTPFQRRMARGHYNLRGHKLNAVHVSDDGILWHTVRLCCGDTVPDTVQTWADHHPLPDPIKETT
jgi:hypothetical protein